MSVAREKTTRGAGAVFAIATKSHDDDGDDGDDAPQSAPPGLAACAWLLRRMFAALADEARAVPLPVAAE